ncbi:MAG: glycosyltransferase [Actinomycetota bacterium]|nr:glycosyltransferase [Actinomycetota bacterium]
MPDRKRVLILGASSGGGLGAAARALQSYYGDHYSREIEVRLVDFFEEFAPSLNILAKFAYQQPGQFFPAFSGTFGDASRDMPGNPVVQALESVGIDRARAFVHEYAPHAVISTFPIAGGIVADLKGDREFLAATVIADYSAQQAWLHPATDIYFAACREARENLVIRGAAWEKVVVSGVPIHERFAEAGDRTKARNHHELADRFTVMLAPSFGTHGDLGDLARKLAAAGVQVAAVAGHNKRLGRRIEEVARGVVLLKGYGFVEGMNTMMMAVDVIIGQAGGLMVSEALAMGLPMIMYGSVPGQELHSVDFIVNSGAGFVSRDDDDVVEKVRFLSTHPERLGQMASNAAALGKPAAARVVCERVMAALR